jgi:hypothetical protein
MKLKLEEIEMKLKDRLNLGIMIENNQNTFINWSNFKRSKGILKKNITKEMYRAKKDKPIVA